MRRIRIFLLIILLINFSCKKRYDLFHSKSGWLREFFTEVKKYPDIYAISYWNENFDDTYLKVNSSISSLRTFRELVSDSIFLGKCRFLGGKLAYVSGKKYFGSFPDFGGSEDTVSYERIKDYEDLIGRSIAWVYFSNNWGDSLVFPRSSVMEIIRSGRVPFIRLMMRSEFEESVPDPYWDLRKLLSGDYDMMLRNWAREAKNIDVNLLVEFGTEVNGSWFSWNGVYYGGGTTDRYGDKGYPDGPEIFRDAYRHIINICRSEGADNITWFYHFDDESEPMEWWNSPKYYYPGDEYIDWIGVSVYGPFNRQDRYKDYKPAFLIARAYQMMKDVSVNKPYAILEFGVTEL